MKRLIAALLVLVPLVGAAQPAATDASDVQQTLARMQAMINHAVASAAEGARLIALDGQGATSSIDALAIERGRKLLTEARELIVEVASGDAMMRLHARELTAPENAMMIATHRLEQAATTYINVMEQILAPDSAVEP